MHLCTSLTSAISTKLAPPIILGMNNFPLLLVDKEKCSRNIEKVAQKCKQLNLNLRPHFKAHQSLEIGELYRKYGVTSITVSSVAMAEFFANSQWDDILLAFPI